MRIIRVVPSLARSFGGPPRVAVESSIHLVAAGVDVTIFTTDAAHPAASERRSERSLADLVDGATTLDLRVYPLGRPDRLGFARGLRSGLAKELGRCDLMDVHGLWLYPSWAAAMEARSHRIPYVVWPHGALAPAVRARGRLRKAISSAVWHDRFLRDAAAWRVATPQEAEWTKRAWPNSRVFVVPNGLDFERFSHSVSRYEFRRLFLPHEGWHPALLALGRIAAIKGLDVAVEALAELVRSGFPNAVLYLVGPDSEGLGPSLRSRASELGVEDRLVLTGPLEGDMLLGALAAADVLLVPSHTESFGDALVEALASGLPAIVAPGVALGPSIASAGAGRATERTGHAFAVACTSLLADKAAYQSVRAAAVTFAARYSWSEVIPTFIEMYETVLREDVASR